MVYQGYGFEGTQIHEESHIYQYGTQQGAEEQNVKCFCDGAKGLVRRGYSVVTSVK
jgi:hypothetical protein